MSPGLPQIVITAGRIRGEVENAVRRFPRFHKFATGSDLRQQIARIQSLAVRAWRDRARRPYWTDELVFAVDDFKNTLQCASLIKAFASHAQFEALARSAP